MNAETRLFLREPIGCIIHCSSSGQPRSFVDEYYGDVGWAQNPTNVLSWNASIGPDRVANHVPVDRWGWNAFEASSLLLAAEWSESGYGGVRQDVGDDQVRAFCYWWVHYVLPKWPSISLFLPSHAEVEHMGLTGHGVTGKWDLYRYGDPRMDEVRQRILSELQGPRYGLDVDLVPIAA